MPAASHQIHRHLAMAQQLPIQRGEDCPFECRLVPDLLDQQIRLQELLLQDPHRVILYEHLLSEQETEQDKLELEVLYEKSRPNDISDSLSRFLLTVIFQLLMVLFILLK